MIWTKASLFLGLLSAMNLAIYPLQFIGMLGVSYFSKIDAICLNLCLIEILNCGCCILQWSNATGRVWDASAALIRWDMYYPDFGCWLLPTELGVALLSMLTCFSFLFIVFLFPSLCSLAFLFYLFHAPQTSLSRYWIHSLILYYDDKGEQNSMG